MNEGDVWVRTGPELRRYPMVCSTCERSLVANEIRDRDGTLFVLWECGRVHSVLPERNGNDEGVWKSLRPASFILVPAVVAVVTMLLTL
jgi:hypothetical protein